MVLILFACCRIVFGEVPKLESIVPAGGKKGTEVRVTLNGKFDPWPCQLWFSQPGIVFTPDPEKKNSGSITLPADVAEGPLLLRAYDETGAGAPLIFVVGSHDEVLEEEKDGNTLAKAQDVDPETLPLVINGVLSSGGELDSYRISLEKGETLFAAVEGYRLRSPIDPTLQVYNSRGARLVLEHDGFVDLDPRMAFTSPEKGDYTIAVAGFPHPPASSVAFKGDKNSVYRLHLSFQREKLPARLFPVDLGPDSKSTALTPGSSLIGTLTPETPIHEYQITAKKGESYVVKIEGNALGFPIDPVLRILKPDRSELRKEDDTNKQADPQYTWNVAADGDYSITVADRFGRGGQLMRYRLSLAPPVLDYEVSVDQSFYKLERGKPLTIKATVTRIHGHKEDLTFSTNGLSEGVTLIAPEKTPEKGGEILLQLEAKPDALAFNGPFQLEATDGNEKPPKVVPFSLKDANSRGPYAIHEMPDLWLTIPPVQEDISTDETPAEEVK